MRKIALFGASGGLGVKLAPLLERKFNLIKLSSKDLDVRDYDSLNKFFSQNKIDIVINMSGYNFDNFIHKLEGESKVKDMLDINIMGNINILSCCLPGMRERKYGRIILFSSILAKNVVLGTSLYSGSKAFIDNLVKTTSAENISKGVTCNSLQLGYFDGGMCHRLPKNFAENIKQSIGLNRWGSIEELYKTINFLIDVEYITGQNINISGGL